MSNCCVILIDSLLLQQCFPIRTDAAGQRDLPWTMQDEEVTKFLDDFKQEMEWQDWQWSDVTWRSWRQEERTEEWKEKTPDEKAGMYMEFVCQPFVLLQHFMCISSHL